MKNGGFNFDNSYLRLPAELYKMTHPLAVNEPNVVIINQVLATDMGLDFSTIGQQHCEAFFGGNALPSGSQPFSQAYAGHQFGHFNTLGDGRAHIWGEHITPNNKRFDIAFKGSGRTPYSRRGDGRAALGPMLREYIISEAMHALGVPTTRSLAVATTGENIIRETMLPGAILTRVASSHIRVGTFEYAATFADNGIIQALYDYTVTRHYPAIEDKSNRLAFLQSVMERQINLIIDWMRIGFIHGVMNTDNMLISGETIDYGPCAFMDHYDPATVFSAIDQCGRYAYGNQPAIAQWNLACLAQTLLPFIDKDSNKAIELASDIINQFPERYETQWLDMMRAKLGLVNSVDGDIELINELLAWMQKTKADYTNTFFELSNKVNMTLVLGKDPAFLTWYQRWQNRLQQNGTSFELSQSLMRKNNPAVIPRNHQVESVLAAASDGEFKPMHDLLSVLKKPYENNEHIKYYQAPPKPNEIVEHTFCGT